MMLGTEFQLPLDVAGFSLRQCPRCDAEFKVRGTRRDAAALASALADRIRHLNGTELPQQAAIRHCPYCGTSGPAEAWWTPEQRRWIDAQARSLGDEIRWRWMQMPFEHLADNPRPTYLNLLPNVASALPPEESTEEMVSVPLPCCGEELQVSDGWIAPIRCYFCGLVHARSAMRNAWLELAQLRSWGASR